MSDNSSSSQQQTDITLLKEGTVISMIRYLTVTEIREHDVTVKTDDGNFWQVDNNIIRASCSTADQCLHTVVLTATQMAAAFEKLGDHVWTVCFHKKVDPNTVADSLLEVDDDVRQMSQAKRRRLARELTQGEVRTMTGYTLNHTPDVNGRMKVMDLIINESRLVDPRTIEYFIYKNTKYVRK